MSTSSRDWGWTYLLRRLLFHPLHTFCPVKCPHPQIHSDTTGTLEETFYFVVVSCVMVRLTRILIFTEWMALSTHKRVTYLAKTYGTANVCQFLPTKPAISFGLLTYIHSFKTNIFSIGKLLLLFPLYRKRNEVENVREPPQRHTGSRSYHQYSPPMAKFVSFCFYLPPTKLFFCGVWGVFGLLPNGELYPSLVPDGGQVFLCLFSNLHREGRKGMKKEDGVYKAGEGEKYRR